MSDIITEKCNDYIIREIIIHSLKAKTRQKVQSRINSDMTSCVLYQIPSNQVIEFNHIQKIISSGKIRIKIYINNKPFGWISYKTDKGEDLINMEDVESLDIFNFPEGDISLYD